jgi:hydrogenase maturation protease
MKYLVIGYGNTLRSDDGAGFWVAEKVGEWNLENVRSLAVHQLTPELAEDIANADTVIFVDALPITEETPGEVKIEALTPERITDSFAHSINPRSLLFLTQAIYNKIPSAYWILIPAVNWEFSENLSAIAEAGVNVALEKIQQLINSLLVVAL